MQLMWCVCWLTSGHNIKERKDNTEMELDLIYFIFTENKAEKEKKREENKRKKEVGLQKNAEFLQSLDIFKQQVKLVVKDP